MAVGLVPITLAGTLLETLSFGVYLVSFAVCMNVLFSKQFRRTSIRGVFASPMAIAALLLFPIITANCIINSVRLFEAFIYHRDGDPFFYYANTRDGLNVAKNILYISEMVVADLILMYRLYYVYSRSWMICVFPSLTILMTAITGVGITYTAARLDPGVEAFQRTLSQWVIACFASTLITNLYATPLIGYRVWSAQRAVSSFRQGRRNTSLKIVQIVTESAAIYTAFTFATFVAYCVQSNLQFITLDAMSPVTGIVFCLIIIRVRLFGRSRFNVTAPSMSVAASKSLDFVRFPKPPSVYSTGRVAVSVRRDVDVEEEMWASLESMPELRAKEAPSACRPTETV